MGRTFEKMNDVRKADEYYRYSIRDLAAFKNYKDLSGAYASLGSLYLNMGNSDSALYYGRKALLIAETKKFRKELVDAYGLLAKVYEKLQSPDALKYYKLSMSVKDSLYSQENLRQIAGYKFSEQLKQKDLERERAIYAGWLRTRTLYGASFTLLVIALFLYRSSRQKQRAKQKIEQAYEQLKNTQSQLIQSEKMASLGELTAGIAHEIQNPLNFVNNFAEVNTELVAELKAEIEKGNLDAVKSLAENIEENEQKISHHGSRADSIVKSMLQHSRSSSGVKEPTDINALADEYLRLAYHGMRAKDKSLNVAFDSNFDPTLDKVSVVAQDIGRVVLNLITNAFYAVSERAKLQTQGFDPRVVVSTRNLGGKVEIRIKDNGIGIPRAVLDKIFQPFFTTKPTGQGTGLGLSLSYDIVKAHGGEIKVEGKENEGTTFTIELPSQ
jgi:signal transduction histidine kinase